MSTHEAPTRDLVQLERIAQNLWSAEPDCSLDERFTLMMRLSRVSTSLERLRFRTDFPTGDGPDPFDIARCELELLELSARWSTGHEHEQRSMRCSRSTRPTTVTG